MVSNPKDARAALALAIEAGARSPCCKSKRGVVIWTHGRHSNAGPVTAFNGPPPGFTCDGSDACREACGKLCNHAEARALRKSSREHTDLLHVKVVNGRPVASGPPSCVHCSKEILDEGIERVWLLHENGLRLYSAEDFHVQTLLQLGLPLIRDPDKDVSP